MTKYTDICGIDFETHKSKHTKQMIEAHLNRPIKLLNNCYKKPSATKQAVYNGIRRLFGDSRQVSRLSITGYNTDFFTMGALYLDYETGEIIGYMKITKDHNYLYLMS